MQLKRVIAKALNESDFDIDEIESKVKKLKGENFIGVLKGDLAEITDVSEKHISANFMGTFDFYLKDGFSVEDLKEYSHFIRDAKPFEAKGVEFADWIHKDFQDIEIEEIYYSSDENYTWLFLTLDIYLNEFDGDFDKLVKELDEYLNIFKDKYNEIKAGVSTEQSKSVNKLSKVIKSIPEIFKNGEVVSKEQTEFHSHGTFTSNSTSNGLYVVEYKNKGLTKEDIMSKYFETIKEVIEIPKPKAGMYSTIYGARKDYVLDRIKKGEFLVNKKVIRFEDLPYEDVFIGD